MKHYLIYIPIVAISYIHWLIKRYIYLPIKFKVETSALNRRLKHIGLKNQHINRFRRIKYRKINIEKEEFYISEISFVDVPKYLLKKLPSMKQITVSIYDLSVYIKEKLEENISESIKDFVEEYYVRRILLVKIRGKTHKQSQIILSKWQYQKYICREKRLRREKAMASL